MDELVTVYCAACETEDATYAAEHFEEGDASVPYGTREGTAVELIERPCGCVLTAQQEAEEQERAAEGYECRYDGDDRY